MIERYISIASETIDRYLGYFQNAYLIQKAKRYDVKGKKYIQTPSKYYYADPGLRNARLGFRQIEETHLMENVLYIDLIRRGLNVDVGVVEIATKDGAGKKVRKQTCDIEMRSFLKYMSPGIETTRFLY